MTMTIEEKAKRFDEALAMAKECITYIPDDAVNKYMLNIFPELKELGDEEEVRKAMIDFFKHEREEGVTVLHYGVNIERMIAWLEKQGEQKPANSYCQENCKGFQETGKCFADGDCKAKREAESNDKNEPKFHEGDWVIYNNDICQIVKREEGCNILVTQFGVEKEPVNERNLSTAKLWDISDARDGDVLFHSDSASNGIFIFKEIIDKGFAKEVICYCDYDSEDHFCLGEHHTCCWTDAKILYPATKEQRDTLEKAMTDAGYTFNFESKELRKIEKPIEWSYEDEANLNNIIWLCNNCIKGTETTWIPSQATKIKHLIETIKEEGLAQQNPAWSEEDEQIILSIEQAMNCASLLNIAPEKMDKIRAWLKSLKDRCTWKPSSLQMECLHDAIKHYHTNGYPASKLKELYEQMSKIYKL